MEQLKELGFEFMPTLNDLLTNQLSRPHIPIDDVFKTCTEYWCELRDYKKVIDQPFKLSDFIPCVDGVPVDEPLDWRNDSSPLHNQEKARVYQQALDAVKFEVTHFQYGTYWIESNYNLQSIETIITKYKTYEQAINDGVKLKIK